MNLENIAKQHGIKANDFTNTIGCDIHTFLTDDKYKVPNIKRYTVTTTPLEITAIANNIPSSGFENYSHNITCLCGLPKIVIILESPHIDEYTKLPCNSIINNCVNKPITPANGKTGIEIEKNLSLLLTKLNSLQALNQKKYEICIVNPVPFQTSLGSFTGKMNEKLKTEIWKHLWNQSKAQTEFEELLEKIPDNSIVINSCTGNSLFYDSTIYPQQTKPYHYKKDYQIKSSKLQQIGHLVEKTIIDILKDRSIFYTKTTHPSSNQGKQHYKNSINGMNILHLSK